LIDGLKGLTWKDILYGVLVPVLVALIIIAFPLGEKTLSSIYPPLVGIFVFGFQEAIMIVAVPMLFGLLWNKWAGGAAGFLLGSIYALWYAIYGVKTLHWTNDISLLGYLISGALIGYVSGALNKNSKFFSRMVFAGVTAGVVGGLFLFLTESLSPFKMLTGPLGLFIAITPRIVFGIVIPVFAKIFHRYGSSPQLHSLIGSKPDTNGAK
jgi:hypothetical protein